MTAKFVIVQLGEYIFLEIPEAIGKKHGVRIGHHQLRDVRAVIAVIVHYRPPFVDEMIPAEDEQRVQQE